MALPFSQSMRSLQADRGMPALLSISVVLVLFLLWAAWFFWAPITRYETGIVVGVARDGRLVAEFPSRAFHTIWQGQPAYIRLHARGAAQTGAGAPPSLQEPIVALPAVVANILEPPVNEAFLISLSIQPDANTAALLEQEFTGEVAVEVERVSPARLVARASGQLVDAPSLSFSPQ